MENEILLKAYHESGRVVFAYLNGFACDTIELPGKDNSSQSKLNAGIDIQAVQSVLSGNPQSIPAENLQHTIDVAQRLMALYCAGTCARIYFENNANIPAELEMDIKGQDLTMLQKIQNFLNKAVEDHSVDFPSEVIVSAFKKIKEPEVWKAIQLLAEKLVQQEDSSLNRFYIEDTLLMAGIEIKRAKSQPAYSIGVHEDDTPAPTIHEEKPAAYDANHFTPLDIVVRDFLKRVKTNWQEEELKSATDYLHELYKKYG